MGRALPHPQSLTVIPDAMQHNVLLRWSGIGFHVCSLRSFRAGRDIMIIPQDPGRSLSSDRPTAGSAGRDERNMIGSKLLYLRYHCRICSDNPVPDKRRSHLLHHLQYANHFQRREIFFHVGARYGREGRGEPVMDVAGAARPIHQI